MYSIDHVVDSYHRYPGEVVTFYTRVGVHAPVSERAELGPNFTAKGAALHGPDHAAVDRFALDDPRGAEQALDDPRLQLWILIPAGLELESYKPPAAMRKAGASPTLQTDGHRLPSGQVRDTASEAVTFDDDILRRCGTCPEGHRFGSGTPQCPSPRGSGTPQARYLVWSLAEELEPGAYYQFETQARVAPVVQNRLLEGHAWLISGDDGLRHTASEAVLRSVLAEESVSIALWARGRYVRHLPEIYEQDELMGRLLMLFESFWAPIELQIGALPHYLDPRTTPRQFMPWLAGWLGLELDDRLGEERQRELIRSAIWLHRRRGTKQALQKYLELYTGGRVQIIEHRAMDFRLGAEGRLGLGVALGIGNHPHTFTVHVTLPGGSQATPSGPKEKPYRGAARDSASRAASEEPALESGVRRTMEAIIEAEKPAHTGYKLILESGA